MANTLGIDAVTIFANDVAILASWYATRLGVKTDRNPDDGAYYGEVKHQADGRTLWIGFAPAPEPQATAGRAIMLNYRVDSLDRAIEEFQAAGLTVDRTLNESYGRFAYIRDPEGNPIEIWEQTATSPDAQPA